MGGVSVGFQIISDQKERLRSLITGRANFEDENYSVNLPIFTIHGNHDNPTRDGGSDLLSAVDLLAISNLVNYFGRQDEADNVRIRPVLLQKGDTRVALYGMGSMGDERLNHFWHGEKVCVAFVSFSYAYASGYVVIKRESAFTSLILNMLNIFCRGQINLFPR
jgi:double-strand break repair protein MRE11